jgi:hypothetical protein
LRHKTHILDAFNKYGTTIRGVGERKKLRIDIIDINQLFSGFLKLVFRTHIHIFIHVGLGFELRASLLQSRCSVI